MDFLGSVAAAKTAIFVLVIPELRYAIGAGAFARVPPFILTDNGPCFSGFGAIEFSAETGEKRTAACFCDPYVSNQKAGAENMNGQLRRHLPKKGNVDEYADEHVAQSFATSTPPR